jgi:hypothetical protein
MQMGEPVFKARKILYIFWKEFQIKVLLKVIFKVKSDFEEWILSKMIIF